MTGEEIAFAADRLRAVAGVRDVSLGTRQGKKGRPVTEYRVLAGAADAEAAIGACFRETSTLGLRVREERRRVLPRATSSPVGVPPLTVKRRAAPGRRDHGQGRARRRRATPTRSRSGEARAARPSAARSMARTRDGRACTPRSTASSPCSTPTRGSRSRSAAASIP